MQIRKFAERPAAGPSVIRPIGKCQCCSADAFIALAQVETPSGGRATLAGGEAVNEDWTARPGWRVLGWIERCAQCFSRERFREEVARFRAEGREHPLNFGRFAHVTDQRSFHREFGGALADVIERAVA